MKLKESYTVDVIIPVYKPGEKFRSLLAMLGKQTYQVRKIIIMNTEERYWQEKDYQGILNLEVHHLPQSEFDHGGTRNRGAGYSKADIMVFMTDDAVPADELLIQNLIAPLIKNRETGVVIAYARQMADGSSGPMEAFTRDFNYPKQSQIKTKADLEELGIKTFFASNVCCAYDKEAYELLGGFITHTIFNEDMIFAGKAIRQGYGIAYAADARVIHSHTYSCITQFHRNFDLAVSQADHPEVFGGIRSESEGIRLVKRTSAYLVKQKKEYLIPKLFLVSGFKYLGYRLGKSYKKLPPGLVRRCSMNKGYWDRK